MTAKEFVKQRYPNARAERHLRGQVAGLKEVYWLIRDGRNTMYMESGKTESKAWVNTKKLIIKSELEKNNQ